MNYASVSVLTIVRGRQRHLDHLIAGLRAQTRQPDELVIAYMQDDPPKISGEVGFPVRCVQVTGDPMPLAKARNSAADHATGAILAFLDVDCIPDPAFVRRAAEGVRNAGRAVFLPEVRYLPGRDAGWLDASGQRLDYARLEAEGERHPARPSVADLSVQQIADFGELWGLAFILARSVWQEAGGMDESYVGYGAEETDFGRRLEAAGATLCWIGGTVCYHQHHIVHQPPLQHFDSIVRNAGLFHQHWGDWCMDYWLDDFARRGLISRSEDAITVLRRPSDHEIAQTRQGPEVRFS